VFDALHTPEVLGKMEIPTNQNPNQPNAIISKLSYPDKTLEYSPPALMCLFSISMPFFDAFIDGPECVVWKAYCIMCVRKHGIDIYCLSGMEWEALSAISWRWLKDVPPWNTIPI
jgi:hypothetical protein